MSGRLCGLCFKSYANLQQHFRVSHTIPNQEERILLLRYGSGRTNQPVSCPICKKQKFARLDKHLIGVHKISDAKDRQDLVVEAKRAYFVAQLALLRATDPNPPMVSCLDINEDDSGDECPDASPVQDDAPDSAVEAQEQEGSEHAAEEAAAAASPSTSHASTQPQPSASTAPSPSQPCMASTPIPKVMAKSTGRTQARPAPSPAMGECRGCKYVIKVLSQHAAKHVLDKLERKLKHLYTPQRKPFPKTGSSQKGEQLLDDLDKTLYGKILQDFKEYHTAGRDSRRARDNARLAVSHVLRFIKYMISGSSSTDVANQLVFLNNIPRVHLWTRYLAERGYKVSSIKNMLLNVVHFFRHVENCFLAESGLTSSEIQKILYDLKKIQREVGTKLVAHLQQVLKEKTEKAIPAEDQVIFMSVAKTRIPDILYDLYLDPKSDNLNRLVIGYMMGYLAILTRHRSIVFCNITNDQVLNAEKWDKGSKYRILVDEHKTVWSFGQAGLSLEKFEYKWFSMMNIISSRRKTDKVKEVFHHIDGRKVDKPCRLLEVAWVDAGCKLPISFNQIRSCVATQASKHLTMKDRKRVAKAMCHDVETAEKFYIALPDKVESHRVRELRMKALKEEAGEKQKVSKKRSRKERSPSPSSTSEESEVFVSAEDSVTEESSLSESELEHMREKRQRTSRPSASRKLSFSDQVRPCSVSLGRMSMPWPNKGWAKTVQPGPASEKGDEEKAGPSSATDVVIVPDSPMVIVPDSPITPPAKAQVPTESTRPAMEPFGFSEPEEPEDSPCGIDLEESGPPDLEIRLPDSDE